MSELIIYRIQDKEGRGPFKPGFSRKWVEMRVDHENLRPWFEEFGPVQEQIVYGESSGCGCRSLKQLKRWFTKREFRKLKKYGYNAVKMKVERIVAESDLQCVFGRIKPLSEDIEIVRMYWLG